MRAIVIALCLAAFPAFAKEPTKLPAPLHDRASVTCRLNFVDEVKSARDRSSADWGVYPIEATSAAKFLNVFNDAEPKTEFKAEKILVLVAPHVALIELFADGCAFLTGRIPRDSFDGIMSRAFGDDDVPGGEWM